MDWVVKAGFAVRSSLAVLCSARALQPVYTGRKSRLLCDQAGFHILSFPHASAHPSLRWDWKRNFWNTQGRPFLWYFQPSQKQEALENSPKKKKNKKKIRLLGSLPAWFPSQGDLEKHLNVSEVIQTRPGDFPSLLGA